MNAKTNATPAWYGQAHPADRTSQTDDQRIKDVTPLPPPEHLIRFFPIAGTPVEKLIGQTRTAVRNIMTGKDDRLLVVIGPCSIHDYDAAMEYARRLKAEMFVTAELTVPAVKGVLVPSKAVYGYCSGFSAASPRGAACGPKPLVSAP